LKRFFSRNVFQYFTRLGFWHYNDIRQYWYPRDYFLADNVHFDWSKNSTKLKMNNSFEYFCIENGTTS
jgi:hypothetical protein